ncbi:DUF4430 domain-containing protein, partial [Acetobacterium paludosum]
MKNIWIEKKKNILIMLFFFITMMVVSGFTSMAVRAEGETGDTWNPATGSYVISTVADLNAFRASIITAKSADSVNYNGKKITLNNDITIDETHPLTSLKRPSSARNFSGVFDGQGHSIIGYNDNQMALFYTIAASGKVYNLNLESVNLQAISSTVQRLGSLAMVNNGKIINCSVTGTIKTASGNASQVGGLVGSNAGSNAQIINCYSRVNIEETNGKCVGGIAAMNSTSAIIQNCYTTGNLMNTATETIYPIANETDDQTYIKDCYYQDTINTNLATTNNFGAPLTETQFKDSTNSASNFLNWNFEKEWKMDATNGGYPSLRYQLPEGNSSEIQVKAVVKIKDKVVPDTDINTNAPDFLKADIESITLVATDGKAESQTIIDGYHAKLELRDPDKGIQNPLTFTGVVAAKNNFDGKLQGFLSQYKLVYDDSGSNAYTLKFFSNEYETGVLGEDFSVNEPAFTFNSNTTYSDDQKAAAIAATETRIQESLAYYLPADVSGHDAVFGAGNNQYGSWLIFTSARAGYTPHEGFFDECYKAFEEKYTASKKVTGEGQPLNEGFDANEVAKDALAITAMGYDARNVAGYNLIEMLTNGKNPSDGYFKEQVSSFAIDSYDYLPGTQQAYAVELAKKALAGASTGNDPLIDMYIMGFQPLAAYYDPNAQEGTDLYYVKQAMETVFIPYFSRIQGYTGVFYSGISYNNPWSNAQVYIMLGMADVDIFNTTYTENGAAKIAFIKNGFSMLDSLAPVSQSYSADQGQIARGYEAVVRAYRNENQIFDCTDVTNSTVRVNNAITALPAVDTIIDDTTKAAAQEKLTALDTLLSTLTLSDTQKNSIDKTKYDAVKAKLTAADTPSAADKAAAKTVTDQITALGTITLDKEADVTAARSAYTALTDAQKALITAETLKILTDAEATIDTLKPDTGTVTIDVERFTIGQGFYKEPVTMSYTKDESVFSLVSRLVGADNILGNSSYMTGIKGTDAGANTVVIPDYIVSKLGGGNTAAATAYGNKQTDSALGTASYSAQGGWMFLVNNQSPTVGMGDYKVNSGDVIRIAFSYQGYGADLTGYVYGVAEPKVVLGNRDELLKAIAAVNTDDKDAMLANAGVKTAYDNAVTVAKDMTETTENTKTAAAALNQAVADMKAAKAVADKIAALPTTDALVLTDKTAVTAARSAYAALTPAQQALVTNLNILTVAEAKIKALEDAASASNDQVAANAVIVKINALGTIISYDQKGTVVAVRSLYNGLTVAQKALISNDTLAILTKAEAAIEKLKPTTGSITIDVERFTIGQGFYVEPVTLGITDGETARQAIEKLLGAENLEGEVGYLRAVKGADTGTATIPDYIVDKLGGANSTVANTYASRYSGNVLGEFDYSKYSGWMYFVNNQTPNVGMDAYTLKNGDVMRLAFTYWGTGSDLTGLEYGTNRVLVSIANKDTLIKALATVNGNSAYLNDKDISSAYDTAMTVVQNMTATSKASNDAATALNKAVAAYKPVDPTKPDDGDKVMAKAVTDQIAALPAADKLAITDKTAVGAARTAYEALSATQKALVTNLSTLTAAEAKIAELEKSTAVDKATGIEVIGLPAGTAIKVVGETDNADKIDEAQKAANAAGITDAKVVNLYDIKPDMSADDLAKFNNDPTTYVTINLPLSSDQQGYEAYKIYHKTEAGTIEWITPTLSADKKTLTFKVNSFSEFGVVGSKTDTKTVNCSYQTQIENIGWQDSKTNGDLSGTAGQSLRLEGIKINLDNQG